MIIFFYLLVFVACLAAIANLVITIFLVIFLISLREKLKEFFSDLVNMIAGFEVPMLLPAVEDKEKTWDQKYEEELADRERRRRMDTGLTDLPPPKADYGEPPAPNFDFQEGMVILDRKSHK